MAEEECSICLCALSSESVHTLKCNHVYHLKCIQTYYNSCRNIYDFETGRRVYATCPLCRTRIKQGDMPDSRPESRHPPFYGSRFVDINEPAYSSMNLDQRPLRLARTEMIIQRERTLSLIDSLVAERRRMMQNLPTSSQASDQPASSQPVTVEESRRSRSRSRQSSPQLEREAEGYSSPVVFLPPSQDDRPAPSYASPSPRQNQQTSPLSQVPRLSQESQLSQPTPSNLQDVQMQLSIFQIQLESLDLIQEGGDDVEEDEDDDEVTIIEERGPIDLEPVEVLGRIGTGRGRHTRYRVLWSDGSMTFNGVREVEELAMDLLLRWRRANATENNRRSREKARLAKRG